MWFSPMYIFLVEIVGMVFSSHISMLHLKFHFSGESTLLEAGAHNLLMSQFSY